MLILIKRTTQILLALTFVIWLIMYLGVKFEKHQYTQISDEQRSQAVAYLEGKVTPNPSGWKFDTFYPEAGIELRTGTIDSENAKGTFHQLQKPCSKT